ncbi:hypothetical protein ACHQM5_001743 [Ranunculus cassubicifolius]
MEDGGNCKRQKRSRQTEENFKHENTICGLPDSILVHILSLLSMEDAVKTCLLSRRWDHLWTKVQNLYFNGPLSCKREEQEKFISFVDHTLSLLECHSIEEFSLDFNRSCSEAMNGDEKKLILFDSYVDRWIRCAIRKKVEALYLNFSNNPKEGPFFGVPYQLPSHIFSNDSFTELMLCFCSLNPVSPIQWINLKSLFLYNIQLSDKLIQKIISGAPLLEMLRISECTGMENLNITSPNLKSLALCLKSGRFLELSVPFVETLEISGEIEHYLLMDVSSLVDVQLIPEVKIINGLFQKVLIKIFETVCHAKILALSTRCLQVLSILEVTELPSLSSNCNLLELKTSLTKWELPGIRLLLRTFPTLQTLIIQKGENCGGFYLRKDLLQKYGFHEEEYWSSTLSFSCLSRTLKTVKILDFTGGSSETALVEFLLKKSLVLQKMIIYSKKAECVNEPSSFTSDDLFKFSQKLLSFPRGSPDAVVLFS